MTQVERWVGGSMTLIERWGWEYHPNKWTVIVRGRIQDLTDYEVTKIGSAVMTQMVVVFKDQDLTPDEELAFCRKLGKVQSTTHERTKHISLQDGILRVTGEKDKHGEEGLFGHVSALDWHANQPSNKKRMPLIWLYGKKGTEGSRTSWINMIEAYRKMPEKLRDRLKGKKAYFGYESGKYSTSKFFNEHVNKENLFPIVMENAAGLEGIYFPFLQMFGIDGMSDVDFKDLIEEVKKHVLKPKFAYHHDWEDGDVVLSEQWLSIHKRWEFEGMPNRVLHRIACDYSNIIATE
jgi:taurine dioxygenase